MKKIVLTILAAVVIAMPSSAQMTKKDTGNGTFNERVSKLWKKTKKSLDSAAEQVRKEFENTNSGLRKVNGEFYMNVYDTNIYEGEDGATLCDLCRKEFAEKYPSVEIRSCVIPQMEWETETIKEGEKVVAYNQTLYCYVLGRDGKEGFINAKFTFERQKNVGETGKVKTKWPLWTRTDVLTNEVYQKLVTNTK